MEVWLEVLRKLTVLVCTAFALGACSSSSSSSSSAGGGGNVKAYDEAAKEYDAAVAKLTLPEGAAAFPPLPKEQGKQQLSYESAAAAGTAQDHWLCAWKKEWLSVRNADPAREAAALKQLEKYPSMEAFAHTDDLGKKHFTDGLTAAKLGDPAGFQRYVTANCG